MFTSYTEDEIAESAEKRAAIGAKFLDERAPGWFRAINTERLNMAEYNSQSRGCILCQLEPHLASEMPTEELQPGQFGNYSDGSRFLGLLQTGRDAAYGFEFEVEEYQYEEYEALTSSWLNEIWNRRNAEH